MPEKKIIFKNPQTDVKSAKERNHTERFEFLMRLIKIGSMLRNAKIVPAEK